MQQITQQYNTEAPYITTIECQLITIAAFMMCMQLTCPQSSSWTTRLCVHFCEHLFVLQFILVFQNAPPIWFAVPSSSTSTHLLLLHDAHADRIFIGGLVLLTSVTCGFIICVYQLENACAGKYGWYAVWNTTQSAFHAPKRLELILFNVPVGKAVLWASCWPAGTTFTISKTFAWAE